MAAVFTVSVSTSPENLPSKIPGTVRFGQHRVQRAFVDLFGNHSDAGEDSDQQTDQEIALSPRLTMTTDSMSMEIWPTSTRTSNHQRREKTQVIEHAVAHRLAKSISGDDQDAAHFPLTSIAAACARSLPTSSRK
jgi:hypothetical protein